MNYETDGKKAPCLIGQKCLIIHKEISLNRLTFEEYSIMQKAFDFCNTNQMMTEDIYERGLIVRMKNKIIELQKIMQKEKNG